MEEVHLSRLCVEDPLLVSELFANEHALDIKISQMPWYEDIVNYIFSII